MLIQICLVFFLLYKLCRWNNGNCRIGSDWNFFRLFNKNFCLATWIWMFGGYNFSSTLQPAYVYSALECLTVTDPGGTSTLYIVFFDVFIASRFVIPFFYSVQLFSIACRAVLFFYNRPGNEDLLLKNLLKDDGKKIRRKLKYWIYYENIPCAKIFLGFRYSSVARYLFKK